MTTPKITTNSRRNWLRHHAKALAAGSVAEPAIKLGFAMTVSLLALPARAATILSVRVWPAKDYTRVTLELDRPLNYTQSLLSNPPRMFIDLEQVDLDSELRELVSKVKSDDPYIAQVRVGQLRPGVVRLVFDMKEPVKPQLFALEPAGTYKHRLVLDLYPTNPPDPLKALLEQINKPATARPQAPATPPATANLPAPAQPSGPSVKPQARAPGNGQAHDPLADIIRERDRITTRPESPGASPNRPESPGGEHPEGRPGGTAPPRNEPQITRMVTIALDPGHGGEDPGAVGRAGTFEKDVVLSIAQHLRELINNSHNMRAFLTRDGDYFVPLAIRVDKARKVQSDLFVSIHADAFVEPSARGASVFVLSDKGASSTAARWLANKENGADLIGGVNLKARNNEAARILLDLSTKSQIRDSTNLGEVVLANLGNLGKLHKGSVEKAGFAVLRAPDIPSILVETAFISNPQEERKLSDPAYQRKMAAAIFNGIRRYFLKYPPAPKQRPQT